MARINYPDLNELGSAQALAEKITSQRGSILHLYRMLLHSPIVAQGWLGYLTSIRQQAQLDGAVREMVIMRIAFLNQAQYEADQHAAIALREGLSQAQLDALRADTPDAALFDERQRHILAYTDAMTLSVQVPDEVFEPLRAHFDARGLVELTATIAAYNMVSRFLEALEVASDDLTP